MGENLNLGTSYLCLKCETIFDGKKHLNSHCPKCSSLNTFPLGKWLISIIEKVKQ